MKKQAATVVPPRIYNLFPRLAGDLRTWPAHARRARHMGFDWIYLNPIAFPGFSGSCYAIKEPRRLDPLLLPADHPDRHYEPGWHGDGGRAALAAVLGEIRALGMRVMIDLVCNHTARDAALVETHPEWYARDAEGRIRSPSAIDPADARRVTVWGDLAELDHHGTRDPQGLLAYWIDEVAWWMELGVGGFRCDAAYKVPAAFWREIVQAARARDPEVLFVAETLGARLEEIDALRASGMPFVFDSSKYWAFDAPWCLEQQQQLAGHARSIAFPESHDTPRLWSETGGRVAVQKQRYAFAAAFASGVLMPMGYEFGFERPLHVVETRPEHWEEPHADLCEFVRRVHAVAWETPAFLSEPVTACTALDAPTLVLERGAGDAAAYIVINKDWDGPQTATLPAAARGLRAVRVCRDGAPGGAAVMETAGETLVLDPAEVVYVAHSGE